MLEILTIHTTSNSILFSVIFCSTDGSFLLPLPFWQFLVIPMELKIRTVLKSQRCIRKETNFSKQVIMMKHWSVFYRVWKDWKNQTHSTNCRSVFTRYLANCHFSYLFRIRKVSKQMMLKTMISFLQLRSWIIEYLRFLLQYKMKLARWIQHTVHGTSWDFC